MTWFIGWQGNRRVLGLTLAGIGARAARLVDGDGDDLQGHRAARSLAITSLAAHVRNKSLLTVCMILFEGMIERVVWM